MPREPRASAVLVAVALPCALAAWLVVAPVGASEPGKELPGYDVRYDVHLGKDCIARVETTIENNPGRLRELRIRLDPARLFEAAGDGEITAEDGTLVWSVPPGRAQLRYRVRIDHRRDGGYDARCTDSFALFRGEDLFPPTATWVEPEGTPSRATLRLHLPEGWKAATPYRRRKDGSYTIAQPHRDHDRPTGWLLVGRLGVNREEVAGARVAIASPVGEDVHRLDFLALLRWTLPELRRIVPKLPDRLLVVSARDPMWRGGLSGPGSLFLHADRPLIQRDGTSPLLHEVLHVLMGARAGGDGDWVVEGLAEYYSLELLRRSKTIGPARFEKSLARLARRGAGVDDLRVARSTGATTARATDVLARLDRHLRAHTGDRKSLDDVLRALVAANEPITTDRFRRTAEQATGVRLGRFFREHVPGA